MNGFRRYTDLSVVFIIALSVVTSSALLQAQDSETDLELRETLQREKVLHIIDEAFIPGDFEVLDGYLSEDYVVHSPFGDLDREGAKNFLSALRSALTDFEAVREPVVVEEYLVATRTVLSGVFTKEFTGPTGVIQPNNKPIVFEFINIFRFDEDGMIVEEWVQFDTLGLFTQLDAMSAS